MKTKVLPFLWASEQLKTPFSTDFGSANPLDFTETRPMILSYGSSSERGQTEKSLNEAQIVLNVWKIWRSCS